MTAPDIALASRFQDAFAAAFGEEYRDADPIIRPGRFSDFQCNAAMGLAKKLGQKPRDIAAQIVEHLDLTGIASAPEIAGPGFLNTTLSTEWIAGETAAIAADERLGAAVPASPDTVVIDYSAPNVAKEMHVGHLRTTVVGDALARTLEFLGHRVIRQNHIGDWGTPFGMLIEHLLDVGEDSADAKLLETDPNAFLPGRPPEVRRRRGVRNARTCPRRHPCSRVTSRPWRSGAASWTCPSSTSTASTPPWTSPSPITTSPANPPTTTCCSRPATI
ncbi:arginine--tRNA ligase [Helcobacillus massiliensis]|uniref:Arginine--tRNA ligase n=1 Tax=Helcobacillus massiliensis TaxID=521392 RepID=A0A839QZ05_9MICO|nr:hypothetical protein [Helcobacillus massiliensis]